MSKLNWTKRDKTKQISKSITNPTISTSMGGKCDSFSPSNINKTREKIEKLKQLRLSQQS